MTKRTRLFVAVASGILVVGLGTGLLAAYVGKFQNLTIIGGDGPGELVYIPADARFVAYADVRKVMDSEIRRKLTQLQPGTNSGAEHFKEQTGIDLETDIDYVVASLSEMGDPTAGEPPLVLARGRFDQVQNRRAGSRSGRDGRGLSRVSTARSGSKEACRRVFRARARRDRWPRCRSGVNRRQGGRLQRQE